MEDVRRDGNVEFVALESADLDRIAVVLQCLDNQWVPRGLLRRMLERGLSLADVTDERLRYVRSEYLRALVNARQLVVNRAFLYNSAAVSQDIVSGGASYEAFRRLIGAGVVTPYLLDETSPVDRPKFQVDEKGFAAWTKLCQEVRPRCVRFSWDDAENADSRQALSQRFRTFALAVPGLEVPTLCHDLEVPPEHASELRRRLASVSALCSSELGEGREITREALYREFVVADGTPTPLGRYDSRKRFSGEIKQLLDLRYNANLPDALDRYPLIPIDSLQRTALQEWTAPGRGQPLTASELAHLIKATTFDLMQGGLYIESLGQLGLPDVEAVRGTEAWAAYMSSMDELIAHPLDFPDPDRGLAAVYRTYIDLARVITDLASQRRVQARTERWIPVAEIVVEVAGAALSVIPSMLGQDPAIAVQVTGEIAKGIAGRAASVVVRLVVRGLTERGSHAQLATSIDLIKGRMESAKEQWPELLAAFQKSPDYEETSRRLRSQDLGNMDRPEPQG